VVEVIGSLDGRLDDDLPIANGRDDVRQELVLVVEESEF